MSTHLNSFSYYFLSNYLNFGVVAHKRSFRALYFFDGSMRRCHRSLSSCNSINSILLLNCSTFESLALTRQRITMMHARNSTRLKGNSAFFFELLPPSWENSFRTTKWMPRKPVHTSKCIFHFGCAAAPPTLAKSNENNGSGVASRRIKVSLYLIKNFVIL